MFPLWSSPSMTRRPERAVAVTLTGSPSGRRTVTSPDTEVASIEVLPEVTSRASSPDTESACTRASAPEAASSPETVLSERSPVWSRTTTSPDTLLALSRPRVPSATTEPDTVETEVGAWMPATSPSALTVPTLVGRSRGTEMLTSARSLSRKLRNFSRKPSQPSRVNR